MFPAKVFPADEEEEVEEESKSTRRRRRRKAGLLSWLWKSWRLLRLVAVEVLVYLALYYAINLAYRFALDERQKEQFAKVVSYFDRNLSSFGRDLTFLLGFYVSLVAKRWWDQYRLLPWPDNLAMLLSGLVVVGAGQDSSPFPRATVVRYALLSYVLCIRRFSANLQRRLPTTEHIVKMGLLNRDELARFPAADLLDAGAGKRGEGGQGLLESNWWLPLVWATNMVKTGRLRKQIPSDSKEVLRELLRFRGALEQVESHAQVAIPAVYKLVVTAAVYAYFALTLVARQNIGRGQREGHEEEEEEVDLFFPVFVVFKLVLLVGWLKVAKSIENPFGEDDVDFEMFPLLRRHLRATKVILSEFDDFPEEFGKDQRKEDMKELLAPLAMPKEEEEEAEEDKEERRDGFHFHAGDVDADVDADAGCLSSSPSIVIDDLIAATGRRNI